jgi:hypothetical protein
VSWVIIGALVAAGGGVLTLSPNGLSLLGLLVMGYGVYRVTVGEARVSQE